MTKTIILLATIFFSISCFGQSFEGKIIYSNSYKSKMPNVTDAQFTGMLGTTQEYYIKDGDYKSITNGSFSQWQLYINQDNKLYSKTANSDTLTWTDGASNPFEIVKSEINKSVTTILGYKCDELILICKNGIQKYYFNSTFAVDPKLFEKHKYGNWFDFLSKSHSLPLKIIVATDQFIIESVATEIVPVRIEKTFFTLPQNAKTIKSPY